MLAKSRIWLLAELFGRVVARGVQILATTTCPTLLPHLSLNALASVVAFARAPDTGDSVCSRLGDLPHFETLRSAENVRRDPMSNVQLTLDIGQMRRTDVKVQKLIAMQLDTASIASAR